MRFLKPEEFSEGALADTEGLTFLLPVSGKEGTFIVSPEKLGKQAVFLDTGHKFHAFSAADNIHWGGAIIPHVYFEVDMDSSKDRHSLVAGDLIRSGDGLYIYAKVKEGGFSDEQRIPLVNDLQATRDSICFGSWQICIGLGDNKRVLYNHPSE